MNYTDPEDLSFRMLTEVIHAIAQQTLALEKVIEKHLFFGDKRIDDAAVQSELIEFRKSHSFYKDLDAKIERNELNYYEVADLLGVILRQFDHYRTLVQNLLGFFSGNQALALKKTPIKLEALLEDVVDLYQDMAAEKCIKIELKVNGFPVLNIDRDLVRRMFVNLLDNAIKYSYSGSEKIGNRFILIECRRHSVHGDWIVLYKSYGVGIEKEEIDSGYIFKYGTRGKLSGDRGRSGTGIGLAEAKRIAEAHNAKLEMKSQHLEGDTYLTDVAVIFPNH